MVRQVSPLILFNTTLTRSTDVKILPDVVQGRVLQNDHGGRRTTKETLCSKKSREPPSVTSNPFRFPQKGVDRRKPV